MSESLNLNLGKAMKKVALIRCVTLPDPDHDEQLLLSALRDEGLGAELLAWDDPGADPSAFDLCVLRSCWNYYEDPNAFMAWIEGAAKITRLMNPAHVVQWNLHKRYLQQMEEGGIPIIPTVWLERGEATDLSAIMQDHSWDEVVVKPAISAGSFCTKRFLRDEVEAGQAFLEAMLRERDGMVQRYMRTVESNGERAMVWIDGTFTHAVSKRPRFSGSDESVSIAPLLSEHDRAFAKKTLSSIEASLLYARVDVVNNDDGSLLVAELELMEPSLFLAQCPTALERFVKAIVRECNAG